MYPVLIFLCCVFALANSENPYDDEDWEEANYLKKQHDIFRDPFEHRNHVVDADNLKATRRIARNYAVSKTKETHHRQGKFWGVGVVRFENNVCTASDGSLGTCYTKWQCRDSNGTRGGQCAQVGTCCVVQQSCGTSSTLNNTYFVNNNFPMPVSGPSACVFTIQKCHPEICQVRIDFLNLNLEQPNGDGVCDVDSLNVIGGAGIVPTICGENSGQHMYVDFNGDEDIRIVIQTGTTPFLRNYRIKVAQIDCECPTRAPSGCLQYYTDTSGVVQSFNYGTTLSSSTNVNGGPGSRQLANTNYGICVAMTPGYCSITWSESNANSFSVSGAVVSPTGPTGPLNGVQCMFDFVVVPNPSTGSPPMAVNTDRFCGTMFPTITTASKPFVLTVVTNGNENNTMGLDPDAGNRGFSLSYTQNRCVNTLGMSLVGIVPGAGRK